MAEVNTACKNGRHKRIWLKSLHAMSNMISTTQNRWTDKGWLAQQTNASDNVEIHILLMWMKKPNPNPHNIAQKCLQQAWETVQDERISKTQVVCLSLPLFPSSSPCLLPTPLSWSPSPPLPTCSPPPSPNKIWTVIFAKFINSFPWRSSRNPTPGLSNVASRNT